MSNATGAELFGLKSSIRPSFAFCNTHAEADVQVEALRRISPRR